jgi:hypothetical protein
MASAAKKRAADPEARAALSAGLASWQASRTAEQRRLQAVHMNTPAKRADASAKMHAKWAEPGARGVAAARTSALWARPDTRGEMMSRMAAYWATPEAWQGASDRSKAAWARATPEQTAERQRKRVAAMAGRTPEQRDVSRRKQAATRLANLAAKAEPKPDANCDETRLTAGALAPTLNPTPTPKGLQVSGFFTTNEVATAMGTTVKTMVGLLEAGVLKCSVTEGGHRRVHSESMDLVREAGIWADDISTTVPRSDLIGAYLRWATLPMGGRPRVLDFVYGYCMCRFGLETHMAELPR